MGKFCISLGLMVQCDRMMLSHLRQCLVISVCLSLVATVGSVLGEDEVLSRLRIDFESVDEGAARKLLSHARISLAVGEGPDGSDAIRVDYVACPRGSERVVASFPLGQGMKEATLLFDVKFGEDFQWTKGGKLHGLGPKKPITGGAKRLPEGWSARIMWREEGKVQNYLYDQDQSKTYGIGERTKKGVFMPGKWHRVVIEVKLNEPGKKNGFTKTRIDGKEVAKTEGVEFRGEGGDETGIQLFMFSTFHGGHSTEYSPVDSKGKFTTVHAWFDNFEVVEGLRDK